MSEPRSPRAAALSPPATARRQVAELLAEMVLGIPASTPPPWASGLTRRSQRAARV